MIQPNKAKDIYEMIYNRGLMASDVWGRMNKVLQEQQKQHEEEIDYIGSQNEHIVNKWNTLQKENQQLKAKIKEMMKDGKKQDR